MDYKVGSLADLISGSSAKKSKTSKTSQGHENSGYKVVFQTEDSISQRNERKKRPLGDDLDRKPKRKKLESIGFRYANEENEQSPSEHTPTQHSSRENSSAPFENNYTCALKRLKRKDMREKRKQHFDEEKESRTVFVKNLPIKLKRFKIKKIFEKYGTVESVRLRCAPLGDPRIPKKVAVIKSKFHPERSNISAYVCFTTAESANQALAENGTVVADHHILVDKAIQETKHDQRKAVFVGNVPFGAEEDSLWKVFESCGNIADIRIIRDRITGIGKGFAYVNFESPDGVELALQLNGEKLKERELRISRASNKKNPNKARKQDVHGPAKRKHENRSIEDREKKKKKKEQQENGSTEHVSKKPKLPLQETDFQGHTGSDKKKSKKKKKTTKHELKKKAMIRKLGLNPVSKGKKIKSIP